MGEQAYNGPERRKYARLSVFCTVHIKEFLTTGITENISGGGICLIIEEKIKVGALVALEIILPGEVQPIATKGKIVWNRIVLAKTEPLYKMGIEFADISDEDRNKIVEYVRRVQEKEKQQ